MLLYLLISYILCQSSAQWQVYDKSLLPADPIVSFSLHVRIILACKGKR